MTARWKALTLALLATAALGFLVFLVLHPYRHVFALGFTGLLLAVAWNSLADLINVRRVLPRLVALIAVGLTVTALCVAFALWLGPRLVEQFENLGARLNEAYEAGRSLISASEAGRALERRLPDLRDGPSGGALVSQIWTAVSAGFGAVGDVLIILFVGLFLVVNPGLYSAGVLRLLPRQKRPRARDVMQQMGRALRRWLLARAMLMLMVGVVFGFGLWILGIPLALPLAVIAGLFDFVPYIGPVTAVLPALAVALMEGPSQALYVGILYLITQVIESYVAEPLIEAKTLSLPPALIILFQVICGLWLGLLGVAIATPLLVVVMVAVQTLYVQDVLGDPIRVSGQGAKDADAESDFSGAPASSRA